MVYTNVISKNNIPT